ncbi:MAG: transposase [Gemmatimonadetes bacterium]|nr:transposase [Gemmatimonadota bacterium]
MHLAVDARTGEIVASDLTGRRRADCARVPVLIEQIDDRIASVSADGAYDAAAVYDAAQVKEDHQSPLQLCYSSPRRRRRCQRGG